MTSSYTELQEVSVKTFAKVGATVRRIRRPFDLWLSNNLIYKSLTKREITREIEKNEENTSGLVKDSRALHWAPFPPIAEQRP